MPLRISQGVAIPVMPAAAEFGQAFGGAPSAVSLPIPLIGQIGSLWCWAACAQMVDHWRKGVASVTQCALASIHVTPDCCGHTPPSSACDRGLTANGITTVWKALGSATATQRGQLALSGLDAELAAQRPVQLGLTSPLGGHVVLVVGVNGDASQYTVHDPLPLGHGSITRATPAELVAGLGQGNWTHSWTNL